ncbi:endonuclease/exonuclease/phosphatase family protein [Actinomycetes bacterium KLBMP 9759]
MDVRLRVVTWNLWWRFGPDWAARQPGIAATLRLLDADVVALQEVWGSSGTSQADRFGAQLGRHSAFVAPGLPPPPDPPERADQRGIDVGLGLLSRWPISRCKAVEMPARFRDPPPVAMRATVDHPAGPLHVVVACLEWEPAFQADRVAQARALAALAADERLDGPAPVVVAGDLNAAPDSPVLAPLRDRMVDAWAAGGGDPDAVTLSSTHPFAPVEAEELIDQRIDHVFLRPGLPDQRVRVERAELAGGPVDGLDPSDHRAVVCDIAWPARTVRPGVTTPRPTPGRPSPPL